MMVITLPKLEVVDKDDLPNDSGVSIENDLCAVDVSQ
jgi:hypothetical protein